MRKELTQPPDAAPGPQGELAAARGVHSQLKMRRACFSSATAVCTCTSVRSSGFNMSTYRLLDSVARARLKLYVTSVVAWLSIVVC